MKPHKHAELIKAWADGAIIERNNIYCQYNIHPKPCEIKELWIEDSNPSWAWNLEYRIKPEPKPDVVKYGNTFIKKSSDSFDGNLIRFEGFYHSAEKMPCNLKLTFDGETNELKSAEVLK
jgi:hypothetical protein